MLFYAGLIHSGEARETKKSKEKSKGTPAYLVAVWEF